MDGVAVDGVYGDFFVVVKDRLGGDGAARHNMAIGQDDAALGIDDKAGRLQHSKYAKRNTSSAVWRTCVDVARSVSNPRTVFTLNMPSANNIDYNDYGMTHLIETMAWTQRLSVRSHRSENWP